MYSQLVLSTPYIVLTPTSNTTPNSTAYSAPTPTTVTIYLTPNHIFTLLHILILISLPIRLLQFPNSTRNFTPNFIPITPANILISTPLPTPKSTPFSTASHDQYFADFSVFSACSQLSTDDEADADAGADADDDDDDSEVEHCYGPGKLRNAQSTLELDRER